MIGLRHGLTKRAAKYTAIKKIQVASSRLNWVGEMTSLPA
jgi:hypothetical protein